MITHLFICKFKKNVSCEKRGEELGQAPVLPPMLPVHACFAPLFFHDFLPSCKNQCRGPGSWKLSAWWNNTEIGERWFISVCWILPGKGVTTDNNFYYLILAKVTFPTMERWPIWVQSLYFWWVNILIAPSLSCFTCNYR